MNIWEMGDLTDSELQAVVIALEEADQTMTPADVAQQRETSRVAFALRCASEELSRRHRGIRFDVDKLDSAIWPVADSAYTNA